MLITLLGFPLVQFLVQLLAPVFIALFLGPLTDLTQKILVIIRTHGGWVTSWDWRRRCRIGCPSDQQVTKCSTQRKQHNHQDPDSLGQRPDPIGGSLKAVNYRVNRQHEPNQPQQQTKSHHCFILVG